MLCYVMLCKHMLRHCHSGLARQNTVFENTIPGTRGSSWSELNEKEKKTYAYPASFLHAMQLREHIIPMQQDAYLSQ